MKTKTIEIKTEKTVNVLETKDFIDFLEDNHAMYKFIEACRTGYMSDWFFTPGMAGMHTLASGPDAVRNLLKQVKKAWETRGRFMEDNWFCGILGSIFDWEGSAANGTGSYEFWDGLQDKWYDFCAGSGAVEFEI